MYTPSMSDKDDDDERDGEAPVDPLSAHLDAGWDKLKVNDLDAARISARAALDEDPGSPEAETLLGAIAAASGDEDGAMDHYRRAMKLDREYVPPMLYAAELLLWPNQAYEDALELIDKALEHADEE